MPRLDVLLAKNLGLSRKQVKKLLRAGRVRDEEGGRLDDGSAPHPPSTLPRTVVVDDGPRILRHRFDLLQHKPLGVVTALTDRRHRTAYALLRDAPLFDELRAVGRLDKETAGLLFWTTDGALLHRMTHPRYAVARTYEAALRGAPRPLPASLVLRDGHRPEVLELRSIPESELHPATPRSDRATHFATISIVGGKFHEVRRIFAALEAEVVALCRTRYGDVELPRDLEAGRWQPVALKELFGHRHPRPR